MQKSHFHLFCSSGIVIKIALLLALSLCIVLSDMTIAHASGEVQSQAQIPGTPQRIVVFPLFAEEMLLEMIGPDRIVYVGHEYWENGVAYSPTMALTEHIQGNNWQNTGNEELLDLKPDLVVLSGEFSSDYEMIYPELVQANIAFLLLDTPETIEDIANTLVTLGETVGAKDMAAQMVRDMEATLAQITEIVKNIPDEIRVRAIYCAEEWPYEDSEDYYYFPNNFPFIARAAGVINASGSDTYYEEISGERLAMWNPDLLTFDPVSYNTDGSIYDISDDFIEERIISFLDDPQLSTVTAIQNRNVHPLRLSKSQYIVQSLMDLAHLAYPDLFSEQDD